MLGTTPAGYKSGNGACPALTSMESRMRAASIKPKLVLRSFFASRSDEWSTVGAESRRDVWVVAEVVCARDVSVQEDSASAMVSCWDIIGETSNTAGRPRREWKKRARTKGLR